MSRSRWKPTFLDTRVREAVRSAQSEEILCLQRATPVLSEIVGRRLHVSNGLRLFPITLTEERVGHRLGEFAPTRKRPVPPTSKGASKAPKTSKKA